MANFGIMCLIVTVCLGLLYAYFAYVVAPATRRKELEQTEHILAEGQLVKCWIVMARNELYEGLQPGQSQGAHVVFTTTPKVQNLDERLKQIAESLHSFDPGENPNDDERITSQVMKSEIGYYTPLRLPDRAAKGLEAYNVSVTIPHELLPEGRLTKPYIYCKVLVSGDYAGARMVEYPPES
jgi:hypothetical protein